MYDTNLNSVHHLLYYTIDINKSKQRIVSKLLIPNINYYCIITYST